MIRLLCEVCRELSPVRYGSISEDDEVRLKCGHYRSTGLLPTAPGRVSVEHLNTVPGRVAFPITVPQRAA